jgi:hypothetical protein
MAFKYHDDWQSGKKTVLQRNAYMFDNELLSDVSFTCEKSSRIFHAHKYVLATSSIVFYAMFYGNFAQNESLICIPDAEEDSFEEFLRFLYTDHCKITAENAIQVMYLAKKYIISSLTEKCCKVLEASIKPDNVFAVLEQAVHFDEKDLEAKCWRVVSLHTQECINSEAFCNIASHTLNTLLKKETLAITEVELFKGVLRWIDSECTRQDINIEEDKTARRRVLGDSVYEIRFLAMSQEDFAKHVSTAGILTDTESVSIFQKFNGLDVAGLKWEEHTKRQPPPIVSVSRFDLGNISRENWIYNGGSDALTLTVNKFVFFHGIRLFGDSRGSQYEVKFAIKDENITETYTSETDNDIFWYDVMLPKPLPLLPGEDVTINATITGPESYKGINGKSSVKVDDIVVTFKNAPGFISNCTDETCGQFYKIFLSKL